MVRRKPNPGRFHLERVARGVALERKGRPSVRRDGCVVVVHRSEEIPIEEGLAGKIPRTTTEFRERLAKAKQAQLSREERRVLRRLPAGIEKIRGYLNVIIRDAGPENLPNPESIKRFRRSYFNFATALMAATRGPKEGLSGPHVDEFEGIIRQPLDNGAKSPLPTQRYYEEVRKRARGVLSELDAFERRLSKKRDMHRKTRAERKALEAIDGEVSEGKRNLSPRVLGKLYLKLVK